MSIAKRINLLVLAITAVAVAFVLLFSTQRQYLSDRDTLLESSASYLRSQPQLQYEIYAGNTDALKDSLQALLGLSRAAAFAAIYDVDGQNMTSMIRGPGIARPALGQLRRGASPVESTVGLADGGRLSDRMPLLSIILASDKGLHQTLPVFALINPGREGLSRSDFEQALMRPSQANSLHVVGFVQLSINRWTLLSEGLYELLPLFGACLIFVLLSTIVTRRITQSITSPLSRLHQLANDIADGRFASRVEASDGGEVKEIMFALDHILGDLDSYRSRISVDHRLLSLKVEERTEQLSRRNQELNRAVREVSHTRNELRKLAYFDALTSLPNRRLFSEQLALLIRLAKRNNQILGLMFLDLDNFKRINDSLGHRAGDLLLKEVASRLSSCVRESDVVAHYVDSDSRIDVSRLGGDEFTVVLNQLASEEAAGIVARRVIETLTQPMTIDGHELVVTPSIGIAIVPRDGSDVDEVLRCADTAMYHAKASGKNNYLYYTQDMEAAGLDRLRLEAELRKAIEREQLCLLYQPQVDTVTGSVIGAEALMRWEHPELGRVTPAQFIPLAEETGLISQLGEWALGAACQQLLDWDQAGHHLDKVSVNVSASQISEHFISETEALLARTGIAPERVQLEITEGLVMEDSASTIDALKRLRALGLRLSIDDFGTGYSSLSYLSHFPIDELKIDQSFIMDIGKSDNDNSLVIAIIAMARSMGIGVVAEGVESDVQYQFLSAQDTHVIQGFLFSEPLSATDFPRLLDPFHFMGQIQSMPRTLQAASTEVRQIGS
ncbi:MAG: EAL domain-containing protein [Pseudomonadota bacterium]